MNSTGVRLLLLLLPAHYQHIIILHPHLDVDGLEARHVDDEGIGVGYSLMSVGVAAMALASWT